MSKQAIEPDLQGAVLCEDVRAEASGQQTLIGIVGAIAAPTLPIGFLKLCLWTRWCGGAGTFTQTAFILSGDDESPIAKAEVPFKLKDMDSHATNVHVFGGVQFQKSGVYHVEIRLDDAIKLRFPVPVVTVKAAPPSHN